MSHDLQDDLIGRIERLEHANRRWKFTSFGSLAVILALLAVTAILLSAQRPVQGQPNAQPKIDPQQFPVDGSHQSTVYTNFCRVNVTPEELILDFGLNTQMTPNVAEPVKVTNRCVMNYYTAKRLLQALAGVVHQHENTYGVLELDFQKRVKPGAPAPGK
jgi:hypothetical protein